MFRGSSGPSLSACTIMGGRMITAPLRGETLLFHTRSFANCELISGRYLCRRHDGGLRGDIGASSGWPAGLGWLRHLLVGMANRRGYPLADQMKHPFCLAGSKCNETTYYGESGAQAGLRFGLRFVTCIKPMGRSGAAVTRSPMFSSRCGRCRSTQYVSINSIIL